MVYNYGYKHQTLLFILLIRKYPVEDIENLAALKPFDLITFLKP
jgi:hypothetical protein